MSLNMKLWFLFKTTHKPSGAMFFGIHGSTDFNYGTDEAKDPYLGNGTKLVPLIKRDGAAAFKVQQLYVGAEQECYDRLARIQLVFDHPLCLNSPDDAPKSEAHKAAISKSLETAMKGNKNALGNVQPNANPRQAWFNNGSEEELMPVGTDRKPADPEFASWVIGRLVNDKPKAKSGVKVKEIDKTQV